MPFKSGPEIVCADCGSRRGGGGHSGSLSCEVQREIRDRLARGLQPIDGCFRSILDEAAVAYEVGRSYDARRGKAREQLYAPSWAAVAIAAPRIEVWGHALTDRRPLWQRRRLLQLAALRWCQTDVNHRLAIEAAIGTLRVSGPLNTQLASAVAVRQIFVQNVDLDPAASYQFVRRGERTRRAVLART